MQFVRIFVFFHWLPAFRINSCTRRCTSSNVWSVANLNIMYKSLNKIVQTLFQNLLWKIRMIWKKGNRNLLWNFRQIVWRAGHSAVRALHVFKKVVGQDGSMPHTSFWLVDSALLIDRSELWIQLLINFEKGIRRQLHFLSLQVHLFKKTRNVFCLKLIKVKLFNFSVWHFYFLRKNIWQTCLFLPNSIKICREQKDFSARFSDKSESVSWDFFFVSTENVCCPPKLFSLRNTSKSVRF